MSFNPLGNWPSARSPGLSVPLSSHSPGRAWNRFTVSARICSVDLAAFTRINQAVLLATLRGLAEQGFSGDVGFHLESRQILRTVCETHIADSPEPSKDAIQSVEQNWPQIERWVEGSTNLLQIFFQCGKITKIHSTDRTEHWQLIHE